MRMTIHFSQYNFSQYETRNGKLYLSRNQMGTPLLPESIIFPMPSISYMHPREALRGPFMTD
jgi:hypothetical protein